MASTELEPYLSVSPICEIGSLTTIMNSKIHLRKSNLKVYLKAILHHFGLNSLSGSTRMDVRC